MTRKHRLGESSALLNLAIGWGQISNGRMTQLQTFMCHTHQSPTSAWTKRHVGYTDGYSSSSSFKRRQSSTTHPAPVTKTMDSSSGSSTDSVPKVTEAHIRHVHEFIRCAVGPMPVDQFLDEFLPCGDLNGMPSSVGAFASLPDKPEDEKHLCQLLVSTKSSMISG
jgi:hypothetical protein